MDSLKNKQVGIWLLIGVAMILFQIVLGGITRLTGSGLSITEWQPILGVLPPMNAEDWNKAFDAYKKFPQYELVNQGMTISQFKTIFFWEYLHRLWARSLGIVFLIPFIYFLIKRIISLKEIPKFLLIIILGGLQGAMGWIMVASGLVEMPWVEPTNLSLHLLLATILLVFVFRIALEKLTPKESKYYPKYLRGTIFFLFLLILVQIGLGGMVAGWKAALTYPTFPKMNGEWIPKDLMSLEPVWKNFLENKGTLQFSHRLTAFIILFYVVFIYFKSQNMPVPKLFKRGRHVMLIICIVQILLGITTLLLSKSGHIPVYVGVMHQFCAFLLLLSTVALHYWFKFKVE
jgi:cytochrome c oxidase assembly protein subunit 15